MRTTRLQSISTILATALMAAAPASAQSRGEWRTDFSNHTVPLEEIVSGGPPKDGIPAIDNPKFVSIREADRWLDDREPVAVVSLGGEAKAYPLQILIWHEIVNDLVGGIPVAVTYCPLCNTALAFDRRFDDRVLDFGTTGRLRHSDLVMYDRQTETWWQQAVGKGIVGDYAGRKLEFVSAPVVNWKTFKDTHPHGKVLSRDTGHRRPYGDNPYQGYDDPHGSPFSWAFRRRADNRLPAMERVVALSLGWETVAYPFSSLQKKRVVNDEVGDKPIVVLWAPGTASALDDREIARGRDVGASGVFSRQVGSRTLNFEPAGEGLFRDRETKSTWNILGRAISGELAGTELKPVPHGNHFWFAWAVFQPETRVARE
ncbi:MAG: DUF3179 domain-containing protein [Gemmatimonadales bacterium]|nr:DUF3179 domain-containing protein [Gemmatimonadales bacterium]NIN11059.1 DUF3179 domain-containing protein [Gemmatimonadales bacterium]NIN49656.1 DUF3179 domain-containing protein [Gemmatimonadales bacterium]NIP07120.1 DUF3179 domain-containing protein [Gemmatimonadales bacterium]NIQ99511.1 DUF3179 domain-containing protein [Gemmatimonadales bacterium]